MIIGSAHMTAVDSGQPFSIRDTHKGQAHFAIPGCGFRCGECQHHATAERGTARYCWKVADLMGKRMQAVPSSAPACRYFERRR